jgi:hypothetical protein
VTARVRNAVTMALVVGGALVWVAGVFADPLGIGGVAGFNWKQVALAEVGLAAVLAGVLWSRWAPRA